MQRSGNIKPAHDVPQLEDLDPFSPTFPRHFLDLGGPAMETLVKEFDPLTTSPVQPRERLQEIVPTNREVSVQKGRFLIRRIKMAPQDKQILSSASTIRDDILSLLF
jgi:hypothetical protein